MSLHVNRPLIRIPLQWKDLSGWERIRVAVHLVIALKDNLRAHHLRVLAIGEETARGGGHWEGDVLLIRRIEAEGCGVSIRNILVRPGDHWNVFKSRLLFFGRESNGNCGTGNRFVEHLSNHFRRPLSVCLQLDLIITANATERLFAAQHETGHVLVWRNLDVVHTGHRFIAVEGDHVRSLDIVFHVVVELDHRTGIEGTDSCGRWWWWWRRLSRHHILLRR